MRCVTLGGGKITSRMKFLTHICYFTMPLLCVYEIGIFSFLMQETIPVVKRFLGESFLSPVKKMTLIRGNGV